MNSSVKVPNKDDVVGTPSQRAEKVEQRYTVEPRVDIFENAEELLVVAEMPGVEPGGLKVQVVAGELSLEGSWPSGEQGNALGREFLPVDYKRSFLLPRGIDPDKIAADYTAGVLTVHLPRQSALKPRQVEIRTA